MRISDRKTRELFLQRSLTDLKVEKEQGVPRGCP